MTERYEIAPAVVPSGEYAQIAAQVTAQVEGYHGFAGMAPAERTNAVRRYLQEMSQADPGMFDSVSRWLRQAAGVQDVIDNAGSFVDGAAFALNNIGDMATVLAGSAASLFSRDHELWTHMSAEDARSIGAHAAVLIERYDRSIEGRVNAGIGSLLGFMGGFGHYVSAALEMAGQVFGWAASGFSTNFAWRSYSDFLAENQQQGEVRDDLQIARGRAGALRDGLVELGLSPEVAQLVSGLNAHNQFISTPQFVDPADTELVAAIQAEVTEVNPGVLTQLENLSEGRSNAQLMIAAVGATTATYTVYRVANPPFRAAGSFVRGAAEGIVSATPFARRGLTALNTRLSSPVDFALRHGAYADDAARVASDVAPSMFRRAGRIVGKRIPVLGGAVALVGLWNLFDDIAQAEEAGAITEDEARVLQEILGVDTVAAFGGFLADGVNEGLRQVILDGLTPQRVEELTQMGLIPPTLSRLVMDAMSPVEGLGDVQRVYDVMPQLDARMDDYASYGMPVTMNLQSFAMQWAYYERRHQVEGIDNPLADHPLLEQLHVAHTQHRAFADRSFEDYMSAIVAEYGEYNVTYDESVVSETAMNQGQLFMDLSQQGPVYARLMRHALSAGMTLDEFEESITITLTEMAQQATDTEFRNPNERLETHMFGQLAVIRPELFRLPVSAAVVTPATQEEGQRWLMLNRESREAGLLHGERAPGYAEEMMAMIGQHRDIVNTTITAYAQTHVEDLLFERGADAVTPAHLRAALEAQPAGSASPMREWMVQNGYTRSLGVSLEESLRSGELNPALREMLNDYQSYLAGGGMQSYVTDYRDPALEAIIQIDESSHGMLGYAEIDGESIADALRFAYMLPDMATLQAQKDAGLLPTGTTELLEAAAETRARFEAMRADAVGETVTEAQAAFYESLNTFMRSFDTYYGLARSTSPETYQEFLATTGGEVALNAPAVPETPQAAADYAALESDDPIAAALAGLATSVQPQRMAFSSPQTYASLEVSEVNNPHRFRPAPLSAADNNGIGVEEILSRA